MKSKDYREAADLYARLVLIDKRREELDPPLADVKVWPDKPPEVTFHRLPTEEEIAELRKQYPGFTVVEGPVPVK